MAVTVVEPIPGTKATFPQSVERFINGWMEISMKRMRSSIARSYTSSSVNSVR
jgi:hypothetical protein